MRAAPGGRARARAGCAFEVRAIKTSGDRIQDRPLAEAGGKGLFTKEIEEALLAGEIDLAVHSMKDMPTLLPAGLAVACFLPREDVRDAFISAKAATLAELPKGAVVGTSSLRRQAQVQAPAPRPHRRADARQRRDAAAQARRRAPPMRRCSPAPASSGSASPTASPSPIPTDEMLPAVAQGAIGVEIRTDDDARWPSCSRPSTMSRPHWPSRPSAPFSPSSKAPAARRSPGLPSLPAAVSSSAA